MAIATAYCWKFCHCAHSCRWKHVWDCCLSNM